MFTCHLGCDVKYKHEARLARHLKIVHDIITMDFFSCTVKGCTKIFFNLIGRDEHVQSHYSQYKCKQVDCDKFFSTRGQLHRHMKRIHHVPKDFTCYASNCRIKFASRRLLDDHISRMHSLSSCTYSGCKMICFSEELLKSHIDIVHLARMCTSCNVLFPTQGVLNIHSVIHGPLPCTYDGCTMLFSTEELLNNHMHTCPHKIIIYQYRCMYGSCDLGFDDAEDLGRHMEEHVNEALNNDVLTF